MQGQAITRVQGQAAVLLLHTSSAAMQELAHLVGLFLLLLWLAAAVKQRPPPSCRHPAHLLCVVLLAAACQT